MLSEYLFGLAAMICDSSLSMYNSAPLFPVQNYAGWPSVLHFSLLASPCGCGAGQTRESGAIYGPELESNRDCTSNSGDTAAPRCYLTFTEAVAGFGEGD